MRVEAGHIPFATSPRGAVFFDTRTRAPANPRKPRPAASPTCYDRLVDRGVDPTLNPHVRRPHSPSEGRPQIRLTDFIVANVEPILVEWESFARGIVPASKLESLALRDHAADILLATARDMQTAQTAAERADKAKGHRHPSPDAAALNGASELHALDRLGKGFDLLEVVAEYRALRASVLRLWAESGPSPHLADVDDVTRFNESIDQSITRAVASFTQRINQSRDLFLAILSHDLRNPLNSIAMSAQLLPTLVAPAAEAVEAVDGVASQIATNAQVMGRMIGDLLDYTRTRLGAGLPVAPAPMDLAALCRDVYEEFRTAHPDREIRFRSAGDPHGEWDASRVRQAISNLMGNAVQHGAADAPIELALDGDGSEVQIAIHNGGPPIAPSELKRIFEPLVRGSNAEHPRKNRPGSIGLGLYIAREVARSHGGDVVATSTEQDGTTFTIHLPRTASATSWKPVLDEAHVQTM
jgi:signal transduction histidine kinase